MKTFPLFTALLGAALVAVLVWVQPPSFFLKHLEAKYSACPTVEAIASATLEDIRQEQKLVVQSRGFKSTVNASINLINLPGWVPVSQEWLKGQKRVVVPVRVYYAIDLSKISSSDVEYSPSTKTLLVRRPPVIITSAEPSFAGAQVKVTGDLVIWLQDAEQSLDRAAYQSAINAARKEAMKPEYIENVSREANRRLARVFELPLRAAQLKDVKVEVVER